MLDFGRDFGHWPRFKTSPSTVGNSMSFMKPRKLMPGLILKCRGH